MTTNSGLRERKKQRTRSELVREGLRLIERDGYDAVTAADIAEAAGVSRATFFNYFHSKEQLVLAGDGDLHRSLMEEAITGRDPGAGPRAALASAVQLMMESGDWPVNADEDLVATRAHLLLEVPQVRAAFHGRLADLQTHWTDALASAFPRELARTEAAALVGAMTGAITTAVLEHVRLGGSPSGIPEVVRMAASVGLRECPPGDLRTDAPAVQSRPRFARTERRVPDEPTPSP